ncbi:MAG TPA: alanine racemase [Bacteroidales bacterium]|nr:alanine racemase [Bacteroidales bacterium]HPS18096.1 alanine racemase [Bacteroidales bacterium]
MENSEKLRYERPVIKKLETTMPNKFGMRSEYAPTIHIDGFAVKELIKQYGSPLFIFSEKNIRDTFKKAKQAFTSRYPKVQFAWSYKTNYLDAVCNVFHQEGSWAEVVSGFEYQKALDNNVPGNKIIFNGPDKSDVDIKKAIENNSLIHIDHFDELYAVNAIAKELNKKPKVAIRVNMDTGVYPIWDRFGFNYENGQAWDAVNIIISSGNLELEGLHCHIGTFMLSPNAYAVAAKKLAELATRIKKQYHFSIQYLDLGGGFASKNTLKSSYLPGSDISPTFDDYAEAIVNTLAKSELDPLNLPLLILETGRALIDEAGYLLGTVIANKNLSDGKRATIIDIGVNLLFTSFWYEHKITPAQEFTNYTENTTLYGPLCMNIDSIRENINLPLLNKGEHLVVHGVGAYNVTQWMQFITFRPKVVMIDINGNPHIIRDCETTNNIVSLEKVPEHLKKFEL